MMSLCRRSNPLEVKYLYHENCFNLMARNFTSKGVIEREILRAARNENPRNLAKLVGFCVDVETKIRALNELEKLALGKHRRALEEKEFVIGTILSSAGLAKKMEPQPPRELFLAFAHVITAFENLKRENPYPKEESIRK